LRDTLPGRAASPTVQETLLQQTHDLVQQLSQRFEALPTGAPGSYPAPPTSTESYATAARRGARVSLGNSHRESQPYSYSSGSDWSVRSVPARHKREITIARGEETPAQAQRTGKELTEQLNSSGMLGQVVAVRKLPSGDSLITLDTEETREIWLKDTKWLAIYGRNARVKRREFVVLAHGIKVNQVQDQAKAKQEIYNQNSKLRGIVELLRVLKYDLSPLFCHVALYIDLVPQTSDIEI
jgi:hypothetical protein